MLAIGLAAFPSTGTDDSYLTYWPAHALVRYGQIVNVNGERVEQSSSLLWTLLLALASKLTRLDVELLGVPLSVAAGIGTIAATGSLARRLDPRAAEPARWLVALAFPSLFWSFSGMETSFAALLFTSLATATISFAFATAPGWASAGALAALSGYLLVRPEAPFVAVAGFAVAAGASLLASIRRPALRRAAVRFGVLLVATIALAAAVALFRHAYFGAWVPQPVRAKMGAPEQGVVGRALDGLRYVIGFEGVRGSSPLGWMNKIEVAAITSFALVAGALALVRFVAGRRGDRAESAALVVAAFLVSALASAVLVGGDWMGGWRLLVVPLPCAIALAARALRRRPRLVLAGVVFEIAVLARTAAEPTLSIPIWYDVPFAERGLPFAVRHNVPHLRDASFAPAVHLAIATALATRAAPLTVLSGQAGYVAYYLGQRWFGKIRFVDRVSLVTRDLEDCPLLAGRTTDVGYSLLTTQPLFDPASPVHDACHVPLPDIVFDNGRRQLYDYMMQSRRYRVVYEEGTEMLPPDLALAASRTYQYLAVRAELTAERASSRAGAP
jgi:hypothetical protein